MTAFTTSLLPTGNRAIATMEELAAWSILGLATLNPKSTFVRKVGDAQENTCTFGDFQDANGIFRLQVVSIFEMDSSKFGLSLPTWKLPKEVSATPLLANFSG